MVATTLSPARAQVLYAEAGAQFAAMGFNMNLAPVVDLHDPANPAIGRYDRAFSADPDQVAAYAGAFIRGFASVGIACALKHFPGHGRSREDSHQAMPDITQTWSDQELEPYRQLIASGQAPAIMGGHLRLGTFDRDPVPTTLSPAVTTGLLRGRLKFAGVAMTDDLDMTGVSTGFERREAVIRAIGAGNDLLMIRNEVHFDPGLPASVSLWIGASIAEGRLRRGAVTDAAKRVRVLRRTLVA